MPAPNYVEYHKSVTAELSAVKDRLNYLVAHRLTRGEYKESALRVVLRRHLPANLSIGRGFVISRVECSTQLDLLIVDQSKPILFQDGDLFVVTPDAVKAVVEVKTDVGSKRALSSSLKSLAMLGRFCWDSCQTVPWLGLYVYESNLQDSAVLQGLVRMAQATGCAVNCVNYGEDRFFRHWPDPPIDLQENRAYSINGSYESYCLQQLSPSYFIGNLVDAVSQLDHSANSYAWFPLQQGKSPYKTGSLNVEGPDEHLRRRGP